MFLKIVLTAPATEMSEYNKNPAIAFVSAFSKPFFVPREFLLENMYRPVERDQDFRAKFAPLGLRRIEASLIQSGIFREDEVAVVHPDDLEEVIREDTKVVGIGAKDPLGLGYVSLTYSVLLGLGEPMNKFEFFKLVKILKKLRKKYRFRVVLGGPGAWQIYMYGDPRSLGIDVLVDGEGEVVAPSIFYRLSVGEDVENYVKGLATPVEKIPCIKGASIYGAVELTRGCGRGCAFCSPTMQLKRDIAIEKILKDAEVNLANGQDHLLLVTEDIFLYGTKTPWEPNPSTLIKLVDSLTELKRRGLKYIQITHLNLAAALYRKDVLEYISFKLYEFSWLKLRGRYVLTTEVGIETGSPKLLEKYMRGKVLPYKPDEWPKVVLNSLINLEEYNWVPLATIIVGLPSEDIEDAYQTLKLVESIDEHGLRTFLVPLLFVPLGNCALRDQAFRTFNELSDIQIEIFAKSWKHNMKYWSVDHFKSYKYLHRVLLRILMHLYGATVAKRYRWRKKVYDEIRNEILECLSKNINVEE